MMNTFNPGDISRFKQLDDLRIIEKSNQAEFQFAQHTMRKSIS